MSKKKTIKNIKYLSMDKINKLIENGHYEKASTTAKEILKRKIDNLEIKSQLYYFLGEINYYKGLYKGAKRYFNMALKCYPSNEDAIHELSNLLIEEYEIDDARKYILRNLRRFPKNMEYKRQFAWCKMLSGKSEEALDLYKCLIDLEENDPKNYIELALSYLYSGDIEESKKLILYAYGRFPGDMLVEDTYFDINEIVDNLKRNMKNLYFKNLPHFVFMSHQYVKILRYLVSSMTLRGYFDFEIEKAVELLTLFNTKSIVFKNHKIGAIICEYIISEITGEQIYILKLLSNINKISRLTINKWNDYVKSMLKTDIDNILNKLMEEYGKEFKSFIISKK